MASIVKIITDILMGETAGTAPVAGEVGEFISGQNSGVAITGGPGNATLATITLSPGDWDVSGAVRLANTGGSSISAPEIFMSAGSYNPNPALPNVVSPLTYSQSTVDFALIPQRFSVTTSTIIYLGVECSISGSPTGSGFLRARRMR
jgi:hypothetical protein